MARIFRSAQARRDLIAIWSYIGADSPASADRLHDRLEKAIDLLSDFPEAGALRPEIRPELRVYPVGNYLILYRFKDQMVEIFRVIHGKRDLRRIV